MNNTGQPQPNWDALAGPNADGRTTLDKWVIDPIAGFATGYANSWTFGIAGWAQRKIYGEQLASQNQSGVAHTAGAIAETAALAYLTGGVAAGAKTATPLTNLVSPSRARHILYGDATGGGHKWGIFRLFNGKSKFPMSWSDSKILNAVSEVATNPASRWIQQDGKPGTLVTNAGKPAKFKIEGRIKGILIRVIVRGSDIITAFPIR